MKALDLLSLTHQQAREMSSRIPGACEITSLDQRQEVSVEQERTRGLREDSRLAQSLLDQLIQSNVLADHLTLGDRQIRGQVEENIWYYRADRNSEHARKLAQLYALLPKYAKKAGKTLRFRQKDGLVYLVINTGRQEYIFQFPLNFFEAE